jgi:hypothetical protein
VECCGAVILNMDETSKVSFVVFFSSATDVLEGGNLKNEREVWVNIGKGAAM